MTKNLKDLTFIDALKSNYYGLDATVLASHTSATPYVTDFHYFEESLYRTKQANYFLIGEGGARTKYRTLDGDGQSWIGGADWWSLSDTEALDWLESTILFYYNTDAIAQHFPALAEGA